MSYVPQPGTLAARAIAHFASLPGDIQIVNSVLAETLAVDPNSLTPCLQAPMRHGLLERFKADGHIYWRRGHAAATPPTAGNDDDAEEGDDSIARVIAAADATPLAGLAPQSWCPPPAESMSSLDEPPAPPTPSPAPALGLGWRAPRVPVYRGEPPAAVPSPRPPADPEPGPGAGLAILAGVLTAEDDPDFREVKRAPAPPEPNTPPEGSRSGSSSREPVRKGRRHAERRRRPAGGGVLLRALVEWRVGSGPVGRQQRAAHEIGDAPPGGLPRAHGGGL